MIVRRDLVPTMAWAPANDLTLTLTITANSANLQEQFGLVAEASA